jgi:hypothetical protein
MNLFSKLELIFTYGKELEELLKKMRHEEEEAQRLMRVENLNLCIRHQQERNGSHFAEHNCDHCHVLKELKTARQSVRDTVRFYSAKRTNEPT